ncbi:hypothetical protein MLD38_025325 [Melastoma candidum]|uniref:Uncharacterized protein n=1 Tax=Melastoma candidum TaxID=119954 RepID=A0ACB9NWS7_9MYRT|nr:hypothetical protein MLD38_025325 [Melastoma candidum]
MAKKRKLRSSEPQSTAGSDLPTVAESSDAPQTMAVDVPAEEPSQQALETVEEVPEQAQPQVTGNEGFEPLKEEEEEEEQTGYVDASNVAVEPDEEQLEENGEEVKGEKGETEEVHHEEEGGVDDSDDEPIEKLLEPFTKDQLTMLLKQAATSHADVAESIRSLADADPVHRKIFVHGLGWDATAEILTSVFSKYGEIEDCKHVTDRVTGKSKGYAFILFKRRASARKALKEPQKKIGNRITSCQLASAGPVQAPPPNAAQQPAVSEHTQRKIFVSNVGTEVDPAKLLEFFRQFGEVEEGPLGLDKQTGKPKGFALFVYKTVESARKALEDPYKTFEGTTLHCQKAIDGPKSGRNFGNLQHQQNNPFNHHSRKDKNRFAGQGNVGPVHGHGGHLMPQPGPGAAAFNPAIGPALTAAALLATQGGGLGIGGLMMPGGYGNPGGASAGGIGGYGIPPGMPVGYGHHPQIGQGTAGRPPQGGGPPYMGH